MSGSRESNKFEVTAYAASSKRFRTPMCPRRCGRIYASGWRLKLNQWNACSVAGFPGISTLAVSRAVWIAGTSTARRAAMKFLTQFQFSQLLECLDLLFLLYRVPAFSHHKTVSDF